MGQERAAEAVEAVRSDLMTFFRTSAHTSDNIFVGSLQKRVSGSASMADRVGPGTVSPVLSIDY